MQEPGCRLHSTRIDARSRLEKFYLNIRYEVIVEFKWLYLFKYHYLVIWSCNSNNMNGFPVLIDVSLWYSHFHNLSLASKQAQQNVGWSWLCSTDKNRMTRWPLVLIALIWHLLCKQYEQYIPIITVIDSNIHLLQVNAWILPIFLQTSLSQSEPHRWTVLIIIIRAGLGRSRLSNIQLTVTFNQSPVDCSLKPVKYGFQISLPSDQHLWASDLSQSINRSLIRHSFGQKWIRRSLTLHIYHHNKHGLPDLLNHWTNIHFILLDNCMVEWIVLNTVLIQYIANVWYKYRNGFYRGGRQPFTAGLWIW